MKSEDILAINLACDECGEDTDALDRLARKMMETDPIAEHLGDGELMGLSKELRYWICFAMREAKETSGDKPPPVTTRSGLKGREGEIDE